MVLKNEVENKEKNDKNERKKSSFSNNCFSLFFNLIISQLFIGAIGCVIELIRIFAINILTKYFLKDSFIQKYGIYIQPIITGLLLIIVGIFIYYFYELVTNNETKCDKSSFISYFLFLVLFLVLIFFIGFTILGFWKIYNKSPITKKN